MTLKVTAPSKPAMQSEDVGRTYSDRSQHGGWLRAPREKVRLRTDREADLGRGGSCANIVFAKVSGERYKPLSIVRARIAISLPWFCPA